MYTCRHISDRWSDGYETFARPRVMKDEERMLCVDTSLWQYGMGVFWLDFV